MDLDSVLTSVQRLCLDTSPIIYFVEAYPRYDSLVTGVFQRISTGAVVGVTSVITLTEVLIQPLRRGDISLQQRYRDLLLGSANFQVMSVDPDVAERAAFLRARYNLRTPDALQVAVAQFADCQAFLTNDVALKRVLDLQVLVLDELL